MSSEFLMSAKFTGKCCTCGYKIDVGAWIMYDPSAKRARHQICPEPSYDGTEQAKVFELWVQRAQETEGVKHE